MKHFFFDVGNGQLIGFMSGEDVQGFPNDFDSRHQQGPRTPARRLPLRLRRRDGERPRAHQAPPGLERRRGERPGRTTRAGRSRSTSAIRTACSSRSATCCARSSRTTRSRASASASRAAARWSSRARRLELCRRPARAGSRGRSARRRAGRRRGAEAQARRRRARGAEGDRRLPQLRAQALRRLRDRPRAVPRHRRRGQRGVRVDRLDHDVLHGAQLAAPELRARAPGGDLLAAALRARARQRESQRRHRDTERRRLRAHRSLALRHRDRARRLGAALGPDRHRARGHAAHVPGAARRGRGDRQLARRRHGGDGQPRHRRARGLRARAAA